MTEPLDFSSVGTRKDAPPPNWTPKRPRAGLGSPRARATVVVVAAVVLVVMAGLVVFGGNGEKGAVGNAEAIARYCALANDFDRLAPKTAPGAAPVDTSASAMSQLLQQMSGTVAEMKANAPAAIRSDVTATVKALEDAAKGNPAGLRSASFQAHRERIASFRQKTCPVGVGSGD